ncbi:thermonuclease family protein [Marinicrinis sediminis]|uniref:Thermonuclease family protein n=1 Tax=Marinicrinis sediminis TaxID=1652465 RepID=A0ABW5R724_9BACL
MRKWLWLGCLLLLLTGCQQTQTGMDGNTQLVTRVVDGDTMKVMVDGKEETVRLLLVDTPESVHPNKPVQPFGLEASAYAKDMLEGKEVRLELDVSERDKYGRLLVYMWLDEHRMFNEMLLEQGLARVAYIYPPNVKYVDPFRAIQREAQRKEAGIWSLENYVSEQGFVEDADKNDPIPSKSNISYRSCKEARSADAAPLYKGDAGYGKHLDRDGDGIACE